MASCHPKKSGPPRPVESPYCSWGCFCRRFALAVHGGDNMVYPWTPNVSGELCGWNFSLWKWPNFLAARKKQQLYLSHKKKRIHWAMDLYQKNNGYSRNTEKKLTIVPRTVFSRKNSMVWGCTTVLIKKENITYANHKSLNEDKNVQYLYPLSQIILRQTNTVLDFLLQYGRPCSPFLREILLVCHLQYSPTAFPTGPCNTHT